MSMQIDFARLNNLRAMNDKPALKSWKESAAKLAAAIVREQEAEGFAERVAAKTELLTKQVEENAAANAKIARLEASAKNKPVKITKAAQFAKNSTDEVKMPKAVKKVKTSPAVKAAVKKLAAKAGKKSTKVEGSVNVSTIAKELGVNPKVARATLRRKNVDRTDEAAVRAALAKK